MPDIEKPTLLVVCDTHQCKFIDVGGHTLLLGAQIESKAVTFTDSKESRFQSPAAMGKGGMISGAEDTNQLEKNRLREFAHQVIAHTVNAVQKQGIEAVYVSAPGKFLAVLRADLPKSIAKTVKDMHEGNFFKEAPIDVLLRFRPDLKSAAKKLKDQENYSSKKHLPR